MTKVIFTKISFLSVRKEIQQKDLDRNLIDHLKGQNHIVFATYYPAQ